MTAAAIPILYGAATKAKATASTTAAAAAATATPTSFSDPVNVHVVGGGISANNILVAVVTVAAVLVAGWFNRDTLKSLEEDRTEAEKLRDRRAARRERRRDRAMRDEDAKLAKLETVAALRCVHGELAQTAILLNWADTRKSWWPEGKVLVPPTLATQRQLLARWMEPVAFALVAALASTLETDEMSISILRNHRSAVPDQLRLQLREHVGNCRVTAQSLRYDGLRLLHEVGSADPERDFPPMEAAWVGSIDEKAPEPPPPAQDQTS